MSWASVEGLPYPLGVSRCSEDHTYNFALYSKHATSVRLLLFAAPEAVVRACTYYGYLVDGPEPTAPFEVHAFHRDKLLLDPYARRIFLPPGFTRAAALGESPNLGRAALGHIVASERVDHGPRPPDHDHDALIYELHVRGFTQHPSADVSALARGTFAGVVERIPYLRELGVTIVELMPVFQFDPQGEDRWGYMPMSFFAPYAAYAPPGQSPIEAFRAMVAALHEARIEVVIDAVYNHTAEVGAAGPVFSFKGIDNSTYYLTEGARYADYAGCGNALNASNRYVRKMILDSMRYWLRDMRVDGFRFDLASIFARDPSGQLDVDEPAIFGDITSDPAFERARMIAEPWDAAGAYELGRAFPGLGWMQWNSRFRDDVRRFVRGDPGMIGALMQRVYGSDDLFPDDVIDAYHAYQSVNYVTCHDGFTLYDLVSYQHKRNLANGHNNTDGAAESWSANNGWEGDDDVPPQVVIARQRQAKNLIALLLLSNGTPMLRAGDEFLQTQGGNDNPYNQDNETTWLDWSRRARFPAFWRFVQQMIVLRKQSGAIGRSRFWRNDVRWFGPRGAVDFAEPTVAWHLEDPSPAGRSLYVIVNAGPSPVPYVIQAATTRWHLAVDTALPAPDDIELERTRVLPRPSYVVAERSVVVLIEAR